MLNFAEFAIDSDSDSDSEGGAGAKQAAPLAEDAKSDTVLAPIDPPAAGPETPSHAPLLFPEPSDPVAVGAGSLRSSQSFNNPPYEPTKPSPAVERTPRSSRTSKRSSVAQSSAAHRPADVSLHSSTDRTPPLLTVSTPQRDQGVHESLYADAQRHATAEMERKELESMTSRRSLKSTGEQGTAQISQSGEGTAPKKRKFNKALFERLSAPLAIHKKYEEQRQLDLARQEEEAREEERRKQEALAPITQLRWGVNPKRFQWSDLENHNAEYLTA